MQQTFTDFKNDFYTRVHDLTLFDCGDINLLKVVLDGLKVNYIARGKVRSYLFYPDIIYNNYLIAKRLGINKKNHNEIKTLLKNSSNAKILIHEINRYLNSNNNKSVYFQNIINELIENNSTLFVIHEENKIIKNSISIKNIESLFLYIPLNKEEKTIRKNVINCYNKIKSSNIFTKAELDNIKYAFHKFFHEYKIWSRFISYFHSMEKAIFICHYHKEGEIYALKKGNIKTIELQHGLIAKQDIFYVFPPQTQDIIHKCLFADRIKVFGKYWRDVLINGTEYSKDKIDIIGYYLYEEENTKLNELNYLIDVNSNIIVITTQTFMHKEFISFINKLSVNNKIFGEDLLILVKPHPSEDKYIYENAFSKIYNVKVVTFPTNILFNKIKKHISVYSTTLYDALRYGVTNYVFKVDYCKDYTEEIINTGIASLIDLENDCIIENKQIIQDNYFYSKYSSNLL